MIFRISHIPDSIGITKMPRKLFYSLFNVFFLKILFITSGIAQQSSPWINKWNTDTTFSGRFLFGNVEIIPDIYSYQKDSSTSGWFWQNPKPQGNDLYALHSFNSSDYITMGAYGTTIISKFGGGSLSINYYVGGFSGSILSVDFINENNGVAVGVSGTILKTSDGGLTWQRVSSGITKTLNAISFASTNIGVIVADRGNMLRTTNGGESWYQLPIVTQQHLYDISFSDSLTGFVVGAYGTMLKTIDGGATWFIYSNTPTTSDINFYTICLPNLNNIAIAGGGINGGGVVIYHSTDAGNTWIQQIPGQHPFNVLTDIYFIDEYNGVVIGTNGLIYWTTNGGTSWLQAASNISTTLTSVHLNMDGNGVAVGLAGEMLRTTNYGADWLSFTQRITSNFLTGVSFVDKNIGSAVGDAATIIRTTDGGKTWLKQIPPNLVGPNDHYHGVSFADSIYGNAAGVLGLLSRTSDGGTTWYWQKVKSNDTTFFYDFYAIDIINPDTGLVVGQLGLVAKLTNRNNEVWNKINHGQTYSALFGVDFVNSFIAYAVGNHGTIIRSTNGGNNWLKLNSNITDITLWSVSFSSPNVGTVVGNTGTILRTTNGGNSWFPQTSNTTANLYGVKFFNDEIGFSIGSGGTILRTTNSGDTWNQLVSPTSQSLRGISIINSDTIILSGGGGTILCTVDGGGVVSVKDILIPFIPNGIILEQNYPNPFNPTTNIRFSVPHSGRMTLNVFNSLGQIVTEIFNGIIEAGTHIFQWHGKDANGLDVASGIYFYKLKFYGSEINSSKQISKTGKMILLK